MHHRNICLYRTCSAEVTLSCVLRDELLNRFVPWYHRWAVLVAPDASLPATDLIRRLWLDCDRVAELGWKILSCHHRFARRTGEERLFWSHLLPKVKHMVKFQLSELGLQRLSFSPHCLRHGGASHDAYHGLLLAEVKRQG